MTLRVRIIALRPDETEPDFLTRVVAAYKGEVQADEVFYPMLNRPAWLICDAWPALDEESRPV